MSAFKSRGRKLFFVGLSLFALPLLLLSLRAPSPRYFEILKNLEIFTALYKQVNEHYLEEVSPTKLMKTGIKAMLKSLDPFTQYISEEDIEDYQMKTLGKYGGVGIELGMSSDSSFVVKEIYEGSPAQKEDLQLGDRLIQIGDLSLKGKTYKDIARLVRGEAGSEVVLTVRRYKEDTLRRVALVREEIKLKSVPYRRMIGDSVAYIQLSDFTPQASESVKEALRELVQGEGATGVILDLRGNPGGLLNEAIKVSNLFVPKNAEVVRARGRGEGWDKRYLTQSQPLDTLTAMVVLIDEESASASEIVAGVIQDYDRGVLVGRQTYGKGLVQTTVSLEYNAKLKITTARYYIPSGRYIQAIEYAKQEVPQQEDTIPFYTKHGRPVYAKNGLMPDVEVDQDMPNILKLLHEKNLLFDFATHYYYTHKQRVPDSLNFALSDKDYEDFLQFVTSHALRTEWEKAWEELKMELGKDNQGHELSGWNEQRGQMETFLGDLRRQQLMTHKARISKALAQHIIYHYHALSARIAFSLQHDPDVKEALAILRRKERYHALLRP